MKIEALFFAVAILPFVSLALRYVQEDQPERVYVDALIKNEGGEGLVTVWIEQGGVKMCRTVAFLARGELRRVTVACPGLAQGPFRVVARAQ